MRIQSIIVTVILLPLALSRGCRCRGKVFNTRAVLRDMGQKPLSPCVSNRQPCHIAVLWLLAQQTTRDGELYPQLGCCAPLVREARLKQHHRQNAAARRNSSLAESHVQNPRQMGVLSTVAKEPIMCNQDPQLQNKEKKETTTTRQQTLSQNTPHHK